MDSIHTRPPFLVKQEKEANPMPPAPRQLGTTPSIKGEPQGLATVEQTSNHQSQFGTVAAAMEKLKEDGRKEPQFIKSVNELRSLSSFIQAFSHRWDELQKHLDFIQNAIDTCSKQKNFPPAAIALPSQLAIPVPSPEPLPADKYQPQMEIVPVTETQASSIPDSNNSGQKSKSNDTVKELSKAVSRDFEQKSSSNDMAKESPNKPELQFLCEMMCSRGLRKYIISHISNVAKLREEAPVALKSAPKPDKLVLECVGRFFLQGSKAFSKDSPMIMAREVSVLILEFFLLMGGTQIEASVKEEAELASIAWRKRLIVEGGISRASDIDARGLLLFVASFGIPTVFKNEDLGDLMKLSKSKEIFNALQHSHALVMRIPGIIEGMMRNGMNLEAFDIALTFGIEDKLFPKSILTSFLKESRDAWKRSRRDSQGSHREINKANKKQLANLKSAMKCLEDNKIDPLLFIPGWGIEEKIIKLEKEISDLDKKMEEKVMPKRKADEIESSKKMKAQELKRSRFTANVSPLVPPPIAGLQEQRAAGHLDGKSAYDSLTSINLLDAGLSGHLNSYHAASSIPSGSGMSAGASGILPTGSYAGVHREMPIDKVGHMMNNNGLQYGWPRIGDAVLSDRLIGHSIAGQPACIGVNGMFRPSSSLEGFAGLPNSSSIGVANRSSGSDLYQFADAVLESEPYYSSGSRKAGTVPPVMPAHHSSYMY